MEKNGNIGRVCRYCSCKAVKYDGDVPVCEVHSHGVGKQASAKASLKDLEANGPKEQK